MSMTEVDDELRPDTIVDGAGNAWTCRWAQWATPQDIRRMLRRGQQVAVRRPGEGVTWLSPDDARELWPRIRKYVEVPGTVAGLPDSAGFTYAAHVWRGGSDRMLLIEVLC
jgi:hypothetical protein